MEQLDKNIIKKPDFLKEYNNGILLNDNEVTILKRYDINPNNYNNIKLLMFDIEVLLNDVVDDELEFVLENLSERNYYINTKK